MNNKILVGSTLSACALVALAAKDPVVMTINGVDVPRSEFEYLYHKNLQQQQLDPQPIEEYAELFQLYKMKVADALAEKVDTAADFRKEMDKYRHDLAEPFLADSVLLNSFVEEAGRLAQTEAEVRHIMFHKSPDAKADAASRARLDSIRTLLLEGQDFTTLATEYSQDPSAKTNGGSLGFYTIGKLPYTFEKTVWTLPEGEVSEIVESPLNYHVIVGGAKRPARGSVHVSHIMKKCAPGSTPEQEAEAKAKIDSIYSVLLSNPSKFEALALAESDDPGSAKQGGLLPWFGAGQMVPEFDAQSFAMSNGEIAAPIRSQYGWHIIKRLNSKPAPSAAELKPMVLSVVNNPQDDRYKIIKKAQTERLAAKHNASLNAKTVDALKARVGATGIDSLFYSEYLTPAVASETLFTIGKTAYPLSTLTDRFRGAMQPDPARASEIVENYLAGLYNEKLVEAEEEWLLANEPDYRNLYNEYRDGSLLYEISLRKVWNKAAQDTEGLERYFNAHRDQYTWTEPHVKGILVQAANDSVATLIKERMNGLEKDSVIPTIRKEFPRQAKLDRVLVKRGDNAMVDNLLFGGAPAQTTDSRYTVYFLFDPRTLDAPEEAADVRGKVTGDYQNQLEKEWVADLKSRFKVKVNEQELKKVK